MLKRKYLRTVDPDTTHETPCVEGWNALAVNPWRSYSFWRTLIEEYHGCTDDSGGPRVHSNHRSEDAHNDRHADGCNHERLATSQLLDRVPSPK